MRSAVGILTLQGAEDVNKAHLYPKCCNEP